MSLTEPEQAQVKNWLEKKCGNLRCACCGNGQWAVTNLVTMPTGFSTSTAQFLPNEGVPQISIVCQNCGHMLFFSTEIMGLKATQQEAVTSQFNTEPQG